MPKRKPKDQPINKVAALILFVIALELAIMLVVTGGARPLG